MTGDISKSPQPQTESMKTYSSFIVFLIVVNIQGPTFSATLIESQEPGTGFQRTWVEGSQLRVETDDSRQYMLMNFTQHNMYLVNPENNRVLDMSKIVAPSGSDSRDQFAMQYSLQHLGKGPVIAGYQTEHYRIAVNGEKCFESFTSTQAVDDFALHAFIAGMKKMFPIDNEPDQGENPCRKAEDALDYKQVGLPLRVIGKNGEESYVVRKLEKNAAVPSGGFAVPRDFHVIDYGAVILRMTQQQSQ